MASNDYYQFPSSNSFQTFSNIIPNQMFSKYKPIQPSQNPTPLFQENKVDGLLEWTCSHKW